MKSRIASERRRALLLIFEQAHVQELLRVARLMQASGRWEPLIHIDKRLAHHGYGEGFVTSGIQVVDDDGLPAAAMQPRRTTGLLDRLIHLLGRPGRFWRRVRRLSVALTSEAFFIFWRLFRERQAGIASVLHHFRIDLIILCEDNVELDTPIWIDEGHHQGIPAVIIPYTISNSAEFAESYVNFAPHAVGTDLCNRLAAALFRRWVLHYKGRAVLRLPAGRLLALEALGLAPAIPWVLNSGGADAIAVESPAMLDYYRHAGLPQEKLRLTGSLADDILAKASMTATEERRRFLIEHGETSDHPILLCALPPDQPTADRPGCEYHSFDEILTHWGEALSTLRGWTVVIRPHPKTGRTALAKLAGLPIIISYADTATLVPLCDLYLASISATIRWAISCGKPVINHDLYRYDYQDYSAVTGVVRATTKQEFEATLERMTADDAYRVEIAGLQRQEASRWGFLDGRCGDRLLELFDSLVPDRPVPALTKSAHDKTREKNLENT